MWRLYHGLQFSHPFPLRTARKENTYSNLYGQQTAQPGLNTYPREVLQKKLVIPSLLSP